MVQVLAQKLSEARHSYRLEPPTGSKSKYKLGCKLRYKKPDTCINFNCQQNLTKQNKGWDIINISLVHSYQEKSRDRQQPKTPGRRNNHNLLIWCFGSKTMLARPSSRNVSSLCCVKIVARTCCIGTLKPSYIFRQLSFCFSLQHDQGLITTVSSNCCDTEAWAEWKPKKWLVHLKVPHGNFKSSWHSR